MKKLIYTGALIFCTMSLVACESSDKTGDTEGEGTVVDRDSVATEYEVTETTVETDTTKETKTVDVDKDKNDN